MEPSGTGREVANILGRQKTGSDFEVTAKVQSKRGEDLGELNGWGRSRFAGVRVAFRLSFQWKGLNVYFRVLALGSVVRGDMNWAGTTAGIMDEKETGRGKRGGVQR